VFLLIGLQLPGITRQLGAISLGSAISYGLLVSLALIVTRLLCSFGVALFTRLVSPFIKVALANPGWKGPLIVGWAGMRGVVSLAAALSIPLLTPAGKPFPYRDLILFVTFIAILVTLVFQGLTLPWLIGKLQLEEMEDTLSEAQQEQLIQQQLTQQALEFVAAQPGANRYLHNLRERLQLDLASANQALAAPAAETAAELTQFEHLYQRLLARQRRLLQVLNQREDLDEELIRKHLALLDLEEVKLREKPLAVAEAP